MRARSVLPTAALMALVLLVGGCSPAGSGSLGRLPTGPPTTQTSAPSVSPDSPGPSASSGTSSGPTTTQPPATSEPATTEPATAEPATSEPAASEPSARTITVAVWFLRDGALAATSRTRPVTLATARLALTELIAGPSAAEAAAGMRTAVPDGLSFDIDISDQVATVDLPPRFYAGDPDVVERRQAQVVYTLSQFPTVSEVRFRSNGHPRGGRVDRGAYVDLVPPIVVATPVIGSRVTSPVTVAGTADVFEATVNIRILDAAGREIASGFTTATCGTGCRGDYAVRIRYQLPTAQPGTVEVFEVSAANGSRTHLVEIPVTLGAG